MAIAMTGSLSLYIIKGMTIIDPFISAVLLFLSIGFLSLAVLKRQESEI